LFGGTKHNVAVPEPFPGVSGSGVELPGRMGLTSLMPIQQTPAPLADLSLAEAHRWALFLDFDGTLADIVDHPDAVVLPAPTRLALEAIARALDGAVAIVTGRSIEDIDRFVALDGMAVAGVHGLNRRDRAGRRHDAALADQSLAAARSRLEDISLGAEGTFLEHKSGSMAFHYRGRPDLAEEMNTRIGAAIEGLEGLHRVDGKMVIEIKGARASKGDAVTSFMAEEPFGGRIPLFAGDDVTDEDAFRATNALGGVTIKIGPGNTVALYRAESPTVFRDWLGRLAEFCLSRNLP
jgi:trehalose 6-phosphate phosphatase